MYEFGMASVEIVSAPNCVNLVVFFLSFFPGIDKRYKRTLPHPHGTVIS
jgi:hypothetical protein